MKRPSLASWVSARCWSAAHCFTTAAPVGLCFLERCVAHQLGRKQEPDAALECSQVELELVRGVVAVGAADHEP